MMAAKPKDIPGLHKPTKPSGKLNLQRGEIKKQLSPGEFRQLCGNKDKYPIYFSASSAGFQLSNADFLKRLQPNALKELDLSSNELSELPSLSEQKKLRRLVVEKNCITKISFEGLTSLQHVSIAFNDLEFIPDLSDLTKCVYLDLKGNRIQDGFANLSKIPSLRVLDLQKNNIDLPFTQIFPVLIKPLKFLPKLQFLSLESNPVESAIKNFRYFVIHQLPKLEFYNYVRITKEDRAKAEELAESDSFQPQKARALSSIVLTQDINVSPASDPLIDEDEKLNNLLRGDSLRGVPGSEIMGEYAEMPDFGALDQILESIEAPSVIGGDDPDDLNALLDDLCSDDIALPDFNEDKSRLNSVASVDTGLQEDPLDDILNYLDESDVSQSIPSTPEMRRNVEMIARPSESQIIASSQSLTNQPMAMEDEADYFELLDDMIAPSMDPTNPLESTPSGNEILSMLDELITHEQEQEAPVGISEENSSRFELIRSRSFVNEGEHRDSLEDMLSQLDTESPISDHNLDSLLQDVVETKQQEPQQDTNDDLLMDLLSEMADDPSLSRDSYNTTPEPQPTPTKDDSNDDDVLMGLLSQMESTSSPVPQESVLSQPKQFIDPLDELNDSLMSWDNETEQNKKEQEKLAREQEQERIAREATIKAAKIEETRQRQEQERIAREANAKREREELAAREEALRVQRQEEIKLQLELEEKRAAERLAKLEEEERQLEEELKERTRREEERRAEEERARIEAETKKQQDLEAKKRREEEERARREEEQRIQQELEQKRLAAEKREQELRAKVEAKKKLLLQQQEEEEERKRKETEEMMRLLEEEQKREEAKRLAEAEAERRQMEERGYVDELVNQLDGDTNEQNNFDELSNIQSHELNELRHIRFPYALNIDEIQCFELLGGGTFGSCYRGIYNNKEVILKKLNCNMIQDQYFMEQFKEEATRICQLRHPQLIDVRGVCIVDKLALVTEYIQGVPLFGMLRNRGVVLDISERIRFAQQIAMGLAYLHKQGLVFSGLKTKNILINSNNDVVLRDFGLLCIKDFVKSQGSIGTPQYTAPEVIENISTEHHQTEDVYSFGIVLWELFTGKSPFAGMMSKQVVVAVTNDCIRPDEPLDCPIVLWKVMQSCWHPDPASRPDFDRLTRILNQPLDSIMKYGMTTGSSEPVPRGAPIDEQAAYDARKNDSQASTTTEDKIHVVLRQVKQMLLSDNPEAKTKALKVLVNIGRTETNIKPILDNGIMLILHKLLKSDDWTLRENSARALGVLSEWPACEKVSRDEGIILTLVQNLSHPSEVVILQCAKTLITLTKEPASQKALRASGGITPLLTMLDSPNEMFVLQGVWIFSHVLEDDQCQHDFYEAGGVRKLLMLLGSRNPGIQFRVLVALGSLISNATIYPIIEKAAVLKRFLMLLDSKSPILRLQAAKATERMSSKGALRAEITKNGGMDTLIRLLNPENDQELIMAASRRTSAVLQVLENKNHIVQYQGIRFFRSFVDKDELNKEISRAIGFIPRCIGLLTSSHPGIQKTSVETLVELCSSPKCIETIQAGGGIPPLLSLIDHPSDDLKESAIIVISKIVSHDDSVRETIISTGSVKKIIHLLRSPSLRIKEASVMVLCPLCNDEQVRGFVMSLNGIPSLVSVVQSSGDEKVQEDILCAFNSFIREVQYHDLIMQSGAAEAILSFLNSPRVVVQTAAIRCTLLLCANAPNREMLCSLNAVALLQQLAQNAPSPSLQAAASKCVSFLQ